MKDEFYTGFVADHYELLVPDDEYGSYAFFEKAIRDGGEPALELACGTGRPILAFREAGIDVEGIDSSPDMLARCRRNADALGVEVRVLEQRMESFDVGRKFGTVYAVSGSFMLLADDTLVRQSLATIHDHLLPGGRVLLALHIPNLSPEQATSREWVANRSAVREDGAEVRCLGRVERFDERERIFETTLRYQLERAGRVEYEEDRSFLLHWHSQQGIQALLEEAGFEDARAVRGDWTPSDPGDPVFLFVGTRPA